MGLTLQPVSLSWLQCFDSHLYLLSPHHLLPLPERLYEHAFKKKIEAPMFIFMLKRKDKAEQQPGLLLLNISVSRGLAMCSLLSSCV